ncbi:MAG: hypothetical protein ACYCXW_14175 [Solirubrobacteraceae bacterium]
MKKLVILAAGCAALAGCGTGVHPRLIGAHEVPLPPGAVISAQVRSCDRGSNRYCSIQMVVTGARYGTSSALQDAEQHLLAARKWGFSIGATKHEQAASSPGNELRMTFAPAYEDLLALDFGWIKRTAAISHALSNAVFDGAPALSIQLERGSS